MSQNLKDVQINVNLMSECECYLIHVKIMGNGNLRVDKYSWNHSSLYKSTCKAKQEVGGNSRVYHLKYLQM